MKRKKAKKRTRAQSGCGSCHSWGTNGHCPSGPRNSVRAAVAWYLKERAPELDAELASFERSSLGETVEAAARAECASGKVHPHQRLVGRERLDEWAKRLKGQVARLSAAKDFDALMRIVDAVADDLDGVGELAVYDTALRIGWKLGKHPERIYLHAGTKSGARKLAGVHGSSVEKQALCAKHPALRRLEEY